MKENKKVVTLFFQDDCSHVSSFPGSLFLQHCINIKDSVILFVESYSVSSVAEYLASLLSHGQTGNTSALQYFKLVHNPQIPRISGCQPVNLWNSSKRFTHLYRHQILINREK